MVLTSRRFCRWYVPIPLMAVPGWIIPVLWASYCLWPVTEILWSWFLVPRYDDATEPVIEAPATATLEADSRSHSLDAWSVSSLSFKWQPEPRERLAPKLTSPMDGFATISRPRCPRLCPRKLSRFRVLRFPSTVSKFRVSGKVPGSAPEVPNYIPKIK